MSVVDAIKAFTEGASLRSIVLDAALNAAVNYGGGKALDKLVDVAAPAIGMVGHKVAAKVLKPATLERQITRHHVYPIFLGGPKKGILAGLSSNMQTEFHNLLYENLIRELGLPRRMRTASAKEWEAVLRKIPGGREQMLRILIETSQQFDQRLGGDVLTSALLEQLETMGLLSD